MKESQEHCPKCGMRTHWLLVHTNEACERQQEINRRNLGLTCPWCGSSAPHKPGCPSKTKPAGDQWICRACWDDLGRIGQPNYALAEGPTPCSECRRVFKPGEITLVSF